MEATNHEGKPHVVVSAADERPCLGYVGQRTCAASVESKCAARRPGRYFAETTGARSGRAAVCRRGRPRNETRRLSRQEARDFTPRLLPVSDVVQAFDRRPAASTRY